MVSEEPTNRLSKVSNLKYVYTFHKLLTQLVNVFLIKRVVDTDGIHSLLLLLLMLPLDVQARRGMQVGL